MRTCIFRENRCRRQESLMPTPTPTGSAPITIWGRWEGEGRGGIILPLSDVLCVVLLRQVLRGMGTLSREANLSRNYFGLTSEKKSWEQILSFYSRLVFERSLVCSQANRKSQNCLPCTSRKHAYIILTPLNPTFI